MLFSALKGGNENVAVFIYNLAKTYLIHTLKAIFFTFFIFCLIYYFSPLVIIKF